jgi:hypothetical protein
VKKEVLIAIIIGFGLGLVITFGIWSANRALKQPTEETSIEEPLAATPTPEAQEPLSLNITSPQENDFINEEKTTVSGETISGAIVVVLYDEGEKILQADSEGQFETEIPLQGGVNEIKITAYNQNGNQVEKILTVVYSTAEIE